MHSPWMNSFEDSKKIVTHVLLNILQNVVRSLLSAEGGADVIARVLKVWV